MVHSCHNTYTEKDRDTLWQVLDEDIGISSKLLLMLKSMYKYVLACVRWNGRLSDVFECPTGLRQGCICSPLAFNLLIGKVADFVRQKGMHGIQLIPGGQEIFQLLFADDVQGWEWKIGKKAESSENFQKEG